MRRNQRLIRLHDGLPPVTLDEVAIRDPDTDRLRTLFAEWGFKTMLTQLESNAPAQGALL